MLDSELETDPALISEIPMAAAAARYQLYSIQSSMENRIAIQIWVPITITRAIADTQACLWELRMKPLPSETLTELLCFW